MPIKRTQNPPKFRNYRKYKPYLRIDFDYRCAYCGITEYRWGSDRNFDVEHFRPKSIFSSLECDYLNLYYACNECNGKKGTTWPSVEEVALGYYWADPCVCDVYQEHLRELENGLLQYLTRVGEYTADTLELNLRAHLVLWRKERRELFAEIEQTADIISRIEKAGTTIVSRAYSADLATLISLHTRLCERLKQEY